MPLPKAPLSPSWISRNPEPLGLFGLYLFALFAWLGTTPATLGLVLLTLAWLIVRTDQRASPRPSHSASRSNAQAILLLGKEPVIALGLAFGLFVVLHSLIMAILRPGGTPAPTILATGLDWLKPLAFIPLAHWCAGRPERVRRLLLLAALGFTIAVLRKIDWDRFGPEFFATRFESYLPAIAFGLLSGLGALGLVALRQAFWSACGSWGWFCKALWALWLAFMLEGLVLSQSRGAWLAFLGGLGALLLLEWRAQGVGPRMRRGLGWALILGPILLGGGLLSQQETLSKRFSEHTHTLIQIARGESVASDPIGLRFKAWLFALERWQERPWFGWGAGSSSTLIETSGRPQDLFDVACGHWLPHLHNTYAEVLVQFGLAGLVLLAALIGALIQMALSARARGRLPPDLGRFYLAALICTLIWCLFNYRAVHVDWLFLWILLAGSLYGFQSRLDEPKRGPT